MSEKIQTYLMKIGVSPKGPGLDYLSRAVMLVLDRPGIRMSKPGGVYYAVADEFGTNWQAAERRMRNAINRAYMCNIELEEDLGAMSRMNSGRLSVSEFIYAVARKVGGFRYG